MASSVDVLLWVTVWFCMCSSWAFADSIQGCGGFVEASSSLIKSRKASDPKLDYSHITVELGTVDGLVKESTQCAPNGYYFIPVYDKGSFVIKIKGPEGWSWDPEKVPVVIDDNGCNANEDINFHFTGFTISGRVVGAVGGETCSLKEGGPSHVKVELLSTTSEVISSALTNSLGTYLFTNIIPGKYMLRASHANLKVETRGSLEVEVGFGNAIVGDIFYVPGYDIQGFVVAQGNPILGVHVYLYSDDILEVDCPRDTEDAPKPNALCHAISDADGKFTFNSIPCGSYELLPYYKGENKVFDVSPPSVLVSVEHHHVTVPQKFQVTGFSVGGRVVDERGVGVDGVKILVDGHERFITDKQGYYKLDQVTSKRYTVVAQKDHYKFKSLENFLVLPNMASVPDIKSTHYDICGVVRMISGDYKAKVALTHGPENVKPQVKQTDENGIFCFEVPSGEYRLSAFSAKPESAPGLLFVPPHIDLMVNSPILNVDFSQAQVNIYGTVHCKDKCDSSTSVSLLRSSTKHIVEKETVALTDESSDFTFPKIFPGKYRLEVKHIPALTSSNEDNWCWERSTIDVDVGTEDLNEITFVQKGYWISIISTHSADAYIHQPDDSVMNLQIKKGPQQICVESPGTHEIRFINSCFSFGSSAVKFDSTNASTIDLKGEKYLLKGQIHVDASSVDDLPGNIIVDTFTRDGAIIDANPARLVSNGNDITSAVYDYSVWANLGDELTFVPRDSRNGEVKKILFYPREQHISVTTDGCQATIPLFSGRMGLYIEGSVSPPITGVDIRILAAGESGNAPLQRGEVALKTTTGEDGTFVGGPLYDDANYTIEASKAGYHLKPTGLTSFSCQKLSQITVHIYSGEESPELFPPVLLSLSGDDGYRNNIVTDAGGLFLFGSLFPGSFYLRPLLKEYSFSPAAQAIELGSGESKEVVFQATRVAYSAMGTISLLSGQPKEGVSIEARSETKGYYEESRTDSSGSYRLRGLVPDTTYVIKVVEKEGWSNTKVERASPEYVSLKVGSEDIKGLDFVVFEQPEMTILSGHVEGYGINELQSHLLVEVKSASDPFKIESVVPLPLSHFFQIRDLPKAKHLVQLRYSLPSSTHRFESEVIEVDLEKQTQIHVGPLTFKVEENPHKQDLTPAPVFPLIIGVLVVALFISMPRLKDLYQSTVSSSGSAAAIKKEVRKPITRKTY